MVRKGSPIPVELEPRQLELLASGVRLIAQRTLADPDEVADAVQETLARAVVALRNGQLGDAAKLGAFVRGIAYHVITDVVRAKACMPSVPLAGHEPHAAARSPLDAIVYAEDREQLARALAELPDDDRRVLHLAYGRGLSSAEVAAELREPGARVRKRKERALDKLRRLLAREADLPSQATPGSDYQMPGPRPEAGALGPRGGDDRD